MKKDNLRELSTDSGTWKICSLKSMKAIDTAKLERLPYSIRILLESALRNLDGHSITEDDVQKIIAWEERPCDPSLGLGYYVTGYPWGHPDFTGWIRTSYVVKRTGNEIETNNSRYTLQKSLDKSEYQWYV